MLRGQTVQVAFFRPSALVARGSYRNRAPSARTNITRQSRNMTSTAAAIYTDRFLADREVPLSSLNVNKSFAQLRFEIPIVKTSIAA